MAVARNFMPASGRKLDVMATFERSRNTAERSVGASQNRLCRVLNGVTKVRLFENFGIHHVRGLFAVHQTNDGLCRGLADAFAGLEAG